jgi:hypothetical protein
VIDRLRALRDDARIESDGTSVVARPPASSTHDCSCELNGFML